MSEEKAALYDRLNLLVLGSKVHFSGSNCKQVVWSKWNYSPIQLAD